MRKIIFLFVFVCCTVSTSWSQKSAQVKALNNYISFTNESIHGLLIVHRLLENFNQDINKYVDLDGFQLNFYSNNDLPKNIFADPDDWFYKSSPLEWYAILEQENASGNLTQSNALFAKATKMKNICNAINKIRFEVEEYISAHDLNNKKDLQGVYDRLEKGVTYYQDFFLAQVELESLIMTEYGKIASTSESSLYKNANSFNQIIKSILRDLRKKDDTNIATLLAESKQAKIALAKDVAKISNERAKKRVQEKIDKALESTEAFLYTADVPEEYKLYKKFYYYHNSDIINKINRYGNGYILPLNEIFAKTNPDLLKLTEEPHFYQVIYPQKLKKDEYVAGSDDVIDILPEKLKNRDITTGEHEMVTDSLMFSIRLYDHLIKDGDKVSINFNGDWVLENVSLENKAQVLKVKLNETGKNYIILHAENIGYRPPNTMAISYYYKGEKQNIILRSDLNESQLINITYDPPSQ